MRIPANIKQYIDEEIPFGGSQGYIQNLSGSQRQLLESTRFHWVNNWLFVKQEETSNMPLGNDINEADSDTQKEFVDRIVNQISSHGEHVLDSIWKGDDHVKGLWLEWDKKLQAEALEEAINRDVIAQRELAGEWVRLHLIRDERLALAQGKEFDRHAHRQELVNMTVLSMSKQELYDQVKAQGNVKPDLMDQEFEISPDERGITLTSDSGLQITIDLVSLNSQWGGQGFSAPRDSYKAVRNLNAEEPSEVSKAAQDRSVCFKQLLQSIRSITDQGEYDNHRWDVGTTQNPKSLYSLDKQWRQQWGAKAEQELVDDTINELLYGTPDQTIDHITSIWETQYEGVKYQCYQYDDAAINAGSWFEAETCIVPSTVLAHLINNHSVTNKTLVSQSISSNVVKGIEPRAIQPDETYIRQEVNRRLWFWKQDRMQATSDLNYNMGQWNQIFEAYEAAQTRVNAIKDRQIKQQKEQSASLVLDLLNQVAQRMVNKQELLARLQAIITEDVKSFGKLVSLSVSDYMNLKSVALSL